MDVGTCSRTEYVIGKSGQIYWCSEYRISHKKYMLSKVGVVGPVCL